MKVADFLRNSLGDQWGKLLVLIAALAVFPIGTLFIREYELSGILFLLFLGPFIAYGLLRYYVGAARLQKLADRVWSIIVASCMLGLVIWGICAGVYACFQKWYPHTLSTFVYTNGNWMVGEKRNCHMSTKTPPYSLDCTVKEKGSEPHEFDVTFTGANPPDLPGDTLQSWTCRRTSESISCTTE